MLAKYCIITFLMTLSQCYHGSISVSGRFECNGEAWKNEMVSVYESNFILPDTLLNSNFTDENGNFTIFASGDDWYPLRPYLYMPNYCNAEVFLDKQWAKYLRIRIPDFYIDKNTPKARFTMDFGTIELSDVATQNIGFQKFTDWIRNFAESRWLKYRIERKLKMSEI